MGEIEKIYNKKDGEWAITIECFNLILMSKETILNNSTNWIDALVMIAIVVVMLLDHTEIKNIQFNKYIKKYLFKNAIDCHKLGCNSIWLSVILTKNISSEHHLW